MSKHSSLKVKKTFKSINIYSTFNAFNNICNIILIIIEMKPNLYLGFVFIT